MTTTTILASSAVCRWMGRGRSSAVAAARRGLAMKVREPPVESLAEGPTLETIPPPRYWVSPPEPERDPMYYVRKPATSACLVDVSNGKPSTEDVVSLEASTGEVVHGALGKLPRDRIEAGGIPLEYLALLRPAAQAAAAMRTLEEELSKTTTKGGTLLVFGASQAGGIAAVQLAAAAGHAAVAVVGGEHSGNFELCDLVKGLAAEPGFMVPEEIAKVKRRFRDLVEECVTGQEEAPLPLSSQECLSDFQQNLLDYIATYPADKLPAAVSPEELLFDGKDADRPYFRENMEAYLEQFPKAAMPIPETELLANFDLDKYVHWKGQFGRSAAAALTQDDPEPFDPVERVREAMAKSGVPKPEDDDYHMPTDIEFDISAKIEAAKTPAATEVERPVIGAVVAVTPFLQRACEEVAKAKTLREAAENLQFLPVAERDSYDAFASVVNIAKAHGKKVIVVGGSLPGIPTAEITDADVENALSAMEVDDDDVSSSAPLDFFVQVYRAQDFPIYEDYAVHRATEVMAGPRQIVITK